MVRFPKESVSIIVPVYGDWPSLSDCIESLEQCVDFRRGHGVILVNDCGPDVDTIERNILKAIKGKKGFTYFRNPHNLGFVGTCNRAALELDDSGRDILLLNSDTIVTEHFLEELMQILKYNPRIGAVSPRTNNATIATIPMSEMKNKGIGPEESYRLYQNIKPLLPAYTLSPVAHGFCMLIRRDIIDRFGLFDPIFGKGYGEETDFCMRIRKKGYLSALCNTSYVFHMEARSFTLETKQKLIKENDKVMVKRYPHYHSLVREYVNNGADIVDRFAHIIGKQIPPQTLIDIRGLGKLDPAQKSDAVDKIRQFADATRANFSYLADRGQAVANLPTASSVYDESNIGTSFYLLYRPFAYASLPQLFIVNRYCLRFMLDPATVRTKATEIANRFNDAAAFGEVQKQNSQIAIESLYDFLLESPLDTKKLRERWNVIHALESRHLRLTVPYKRLGGLTKNIVLRNKAAAKAARKVKSLFKKH